MEIDSETKMELDRQDSETPEIIENNLKGSQSLFSGALSNS